MSSSVACIGLHNIRLTAEDICLHAFVYQLQNAEAELVRRQKMTAAAGVACRNRYSQGHSQITV